MPMPAARSAFEMLDIADHPIDGDADALFGGALAAWLPGHHAHFANPPVVVEEAWLMQLQRMHAALRRALHAVVERYVHDARIRAIYALPPALEAIVRQADAYPYRIGFHRPDLVFDREGRPRICEIGARFPLNGWILSDASQRVFSAAPAYARFRAQSAQAGFWDVLHAMHPPGSTVVLVHAREPGSEIFRVREVLQRRGANFLQARPEALSVRGGRIVLEQDGRHWVVDRCILEMDRTELTAFAPEVLARLIEDGHYFNDVRTLILVHDKRTLAVLWDEAILRDCVDAETIGTLRPWLIPSWVADTQAARDALLERPGEMIAKRNSGGRGIDAAVRSLCGERAWRDLVRQRSGDYMFQDYLAQRDFRDPASGRMLHLIGMLLCHDSVCYGAGVFRGSEEAIINVHQGRGRLFAAMLRA